MITSHDPNRNIELDMRANHSAEQGKEPRKSSSQYGSEKEPTPERNPEEFTVMKREATDVTDVHIDIPDNNKNFH